MKCSLTCGFILKFYKERRSSGHHMYSYTAHRVAMCPAGLLGEFEDWWLCSAEFSQNPVALGWRRGERLSSPHSSGPSLFPLRAWWALCLATRSIWPRAETRLPYIQTGAFLRHGGGLVCPRSLRCPLDLYESSHFITQRLQTSASRVHHVHSACTTFTSTTKKKDK